MSVCTFDNPDTMRREYWDSGALLFSYSALVLPNVARQPVPPDRFFFGANVGKWKAGQMAGDASALAKPQNGTAQ
ncbi:MAG: hypothetical protein ACRCWJ_03490 [Casimicrobium sp.]